MNYKRGAAPVLPYPEVHPDLVRKAAMIARALVDDDTAFAIGSGYSRSTLLEMLRNPGNLSDRCRSDFLRYSREVAQHHKNTFFYLAAVEPTELPAAVYPFRMIEQIEIPADFQRNRSNPHDVMWRGRTNLFHHLWNLLYFSVRPGEDQPIHLYGRPVGMVRAYLDQISDPFAGAFLETFMNGPHGAINGSSIIANPTILDYFATKLDLPYNIWGNALRLNLPDVVGRQVPMEIALGKEADHAGDGR